MASWYYLSNGQQVGPVDLDALRQLVYAGQISPAELVWSDGMSGWLPVSSVPQLADLVATQPYNPSSPPPTSYAAANPYGPQTYTLPYGSPPRRGNGIAAVGIISIIWGGLFVLCDGVALVALVSLPQGRLGHLGPVDRLVPFVSLALNIGLVASGIGTIMRKQWARMLLWVIVGPMIGLYAFNAINSLSRHQPLATQAAEGGYYCGLLGAVGLGIFWMLFLIWFYQRPAVKQEFESAAAAPGQQGGMNRY